MADEFTQILTDEGIPTTEAALQAEWAKQVEATGSTVSNDSAYSPFWRVVQALITVPALWLISFVASTLMPQMFLRYATGTFLELLADGVNLIRKLAVVALGEVTFTRTDVGTATTIPAGTVVQTTLLNGQTFVLVTTQAMSFEVGLLTLRVPVAATDVGAGFNFAAGYYSVMPVGIPNVASVTNEADWLTTPGADVETDEDLRDRVRNQWGLASDFHTDSVYRGLIAQFPGVTVDGIYFEHNAPRGPGTANALVLFDFAAPVVQYLVDINAFITGEGHHGHGDDLQVYQLPEQGMVLVVDVWHVANLDAAEIAQLLADVTDFVNAAFRENTLYAPTLTYPYDRFSFSRLDGELHGKFGGIDSVDFSLADIVSALWVPRLTSLTVNMTATEGG